MSLEFLPKTLSVDAQKTSFSLDRIAVVILGGGEGKRLYPLTKTRCKPTISFGGRYCLIDVPISHSITSGLSKIFVVGQYLAYSLQKHLFKTYPMQGVAQDPLQLLIPEEREGKKVWYEGTADAIRKNLEYLNEISADYFLILSGDQLYNINFSKMIQFALETDAGMVIAAQPVTEKDVKRMGVLKLEPGGSRLIDFVEKPQNPQEIQRFEVDPFTLHGLGYEVLEGRKYLGSMGIYLFKKKALFNLMQEDARADFGRHLIMTQMQKRDVHAFIYEGYWEDIGTIESYYHANLALTRPHPNYKEGLECFGDQWLLITKRYNLPGTIVSHCQIDRSLICEGSILEGAEITHSVVGVRSQVGKGSVIRDSVVMGSEYYEREGVRPRIGKGCRVQKAIIDENVTLGDGVELTNREGHVNYESADGKVVVRDGIVVIPRGTILPPGYTF